MKLVQVLMSTYNGEKYLVEQLQSLSSQQGVEVSILVRDDGSSDNTTAILEEWSKKGALTWYTGSNLGPARSFVHLLCDAPEADYYAFCDQDDVWMPDKLFRAVSALESQSGIYKTYIGSALLTDSGMNVNGRMPFDYKFTLGEAVVTNPATGCTMLFNRELRNYIRKNPPQVLKMHDEWVYKVCLFLGGDIFVDREPCIYYRQHGNNAVGACEPAAKAMIRRFRTLFAHGRSRSTTLCELRRLYKADIPEDNIIYLDRVYHYSRSFMGRFALFSLPGLSAPSFSTLFNFYIAVILGKF